MSNEPSPAPAIDPVPKPAPDPRIKQPGDEPDSPGPNLILMYSLLALALLGAILFALAIVRPFYLRR